MIFDTWSPFFDVGKTLEEMDRLFGAVGRPLGVSRQEKWHRLRHWARRDLQVFACMQANT